MTSWHWHRTGLAAAFALLMPGLAQADCASLPLFDIHAARSKLWHDSPPSSAADIQALSATGRALEEATRKKIVDCVQDELRARDLRPAQPSGTPPHAEGSAGILTDVDDAYATLEDAEAAAESFKRRGYTVEWDTPNSFSVKEIDYVGFSMEEPNLVPGSPEAEAGLRAAARNEDNLKALGSQEWIKGKVQPEGRIGDLGKERQAILEQLDRGGLDSASEAKLHTRLAAAEDEIAKLTKKVRGFEINDIHGFNGDQMKKGAHHMSPAKWCPPNQAYHCFEEPRQAAKAAKRILSENFHDPTPEQQALKRRLAAFADKKRVLPTDPAGYAEAEAALKRDIREAFHQSHQAALAKEQRRNQELVEQYRAAQAAGDKKALAEIEKAMKTRREAARRLGITVDELIKNDHVPHAAETFHEWTTGERLRKVERPGKPPVFEVIEDGPGGPVVTKTLTQAEVRRAARNAILKNAVRSQYTGPPFETRPRFSSFQPQPAKGQALRNAIKRQGVLGILGTGYAAYTGAETSVELINRHTDIEVPNWSELRRWEKVPGYLVTVGLGTVIGIADVIGVTVIGGTYAIGQGIHGLAERAEIEAAQREGRAANKLGVLARLNAVDLSKQLAKETSQWFAEWSKQRAEDIYAAGRAELEAIKAELGAGEMEERLWARLMDGGLAQLIGDVGRLRQLTGLLRDTWSFGTASIDKAVLARDDMVLLLGQAEAAPDFAASCNRLLAALPATPDPTAVDAAKKQWRQLRQDQEERVRKAALATFQARNAAVTAERILSNPDGLARLHEQQAELQVVMAGRLGRLITAAGEGDVLSGLRDEVARAAHPIPFGQAATMMQAALEIKLETESNLVRLKALDQAAIPPCDFPAPIDPEAQKSAVESGHAALQACDFGAMATQLAALEPMRDGLDARGNELLASLSREVEADAAFGQARDSYVSGDLDAAEAQLDRAGATQCMARQEAVAARQAKVEKMRGVLQKVAAARESCDLERIRRYGQQLEGKSHVLLAQAGAELDAVAGALAKAVAANEEAKPAYLSGDLGRAEARLGSAKQSLDAIGPEACPVLRQAIAERVDKVARLRRALAEADRAIAACDSAAIDSLLGRLSGQSHALLKSKGAELSKARPGCAHVEAKTSLAEAEAACRAKHGEGAEAYAREGGGYGCRCGPGTSKDRSGKRCLSTAQAEDEGEAYCALKYDGGVLVEVLSGGGYSCACPEGRYAHESRAACLTWDQVVADAERGCQAEDAVLVSVSGPEDYVCCPAGTHSYDEATNSCWSWDNLVADAQDACGRQGHIAVRIDGIGDYKCCPQGTTRYEESTGTCYDDAQQAADFMRGLGDFLQGLDRMQRGGHGGGTGGAYGGGGGASASCQGFSGEANAHAARMQSLTARYRASASNRAQLQATACEIMREGQRGQQILSRMQAAGCQVPPAAMQYQGAFASSIAQNCN